MKKAKEEGEEDKILLVFTAFDGFLRVYDFASMTPEIIVKSDFGGFNCFSFNHDHTLLAAGGQDDCITIINLQNYTAFKL